MSGLYATKPKYKCYLTIYGTNVNAFRQIQNKILYARTVNKSALVFLSNASFTHLI